MEQYDDIARGRWKETEVEEIVERFKGKGKSAAEEVLAMKPGRELNIIVATYVMGHEVVSDEFFNDMERLISKSGDSVWALLRPYSEDITVAQEVVTRMIDAGHVDAVS